MREKRPKISHRCVSPEVSVNEIRPSLTSYSPTSFVRLQEEKIEGQHEARVYPPLDSD